MENTLQTMKGTEVTFVIPNTESIGRLKEMAPGFSLTAKYKKADDWAILKGQEVRAYYQGMQEVPNAEGEAVNCALFVTQEERFLAGQKVLVEAVKNLPAGTPVSITYVEKRTNKSTEGATMIFDVKLLK